MMGGAPVGTMMGGAPVGTMMGGPGAIQEPIAGGMPGMPGAPVGTYTQYGGQVGMPQGTVMMAGAPGTQVMVPGTIAGAPGTMVGGIAMSGGQLKAGSITDDVFNMVDRNQDGVISRSEFRGALKGNVISASATTRAALGR